jgi:hypothetical protein
VIDLLELEAGRQRALPLSPMGPIVLTASIGAESVSLQVVAHGEKLPPEATMEVLASEAEAAIKATNYLRRSVPDF